MAKQDLTTRIGCCTMTFGLDRRKSYPDGYRLAIKYAIGGKTMYYHLGGYIDDSDFERIISTSITRGRMSDNKRTDANVREEWEQTFNAYKERLEELSKNAALSFDAIKIDLEGKSSNTNFLAVWREIITSRRHGTAQSYMIALKSFEKGFSENGGFNVTAETIHSWVQRMTDEGKSKATIGIYLRSCRVVVNECIRRGLMQKRNYPFSEKDADLVSIPRGKSRKQECLTVEQMTQLYNIFVKKDYPREWNEEYKNDTHTYLGIFLCMYLMNGLNLADLARMEYNTHYIQSGKQSLMFWRQKTKDRSDNNSEVIVPIIEPLRRILGEIAAKDEKDERLFPFLLKGAVSDEDKARRVQQANQNCKKHIRKLTAALGWSVEPSPTWCRHSFATNMALQGVPMKYISDAMGHSTGGSVTMGYINMYTHARQVEYNNKLLNLAKEDEMESLVEGLSKNDREKLLNLLLTNK